MARARRIGRRILIGLAGVAVVLIVLRFGGELFLHTAGGRSVVADRLGAMIGLPVEVAKLDVGARTSSIKFRVLDPALSSSPDAEIIAVESATADVSFADLVTGRADPSELHLRGVNVVLRLDAKGKLLTTLPTTPTGTAGTDTKIPRVTVENARVAVRQDGRPEFVLAGLSLQTGAAGEKVIVSGAVDDPGWGKWTIAGEVDKATRTGHVDLSSDDAPFEIERLKSIPFIPSEVWANARPAGRGKATGRFALTPEKELTYDVRVQAQAASLAVPVAEVSLTDLQGVVRINDGLISVAGEKDDTPATAKLAGGTVQATARWNYNQEPSVGDPLSITVNRLAVKDLPEKWGLRTLGGGLPGKLSLENGFLSGGAKIRLVVHADGKTETYGGGKGKIEVPAFVGGSLKIGVNLGGDGQKLEFNPAPSGDAAPPGTATEQSAVPVPPRTLSVTVTEERELVALLTLLAVQPPPAEPTNLDATITLRDIDVSQLLQQFEVKLPYPVSGRVTVEAKLGVPLTEIDTRASYRLTGTLKSPELTFAGLTVRDLTTEVNYQNGKLSLSTLRATFPQPGDPAAQPGSLSGSATAALDPIGPMSASLTLDRIPVGAVASVIPGLDLEASGLVSGKAEFAAPFEHLADPTTWTASASVRSDELTIAGRTAKSVSFTAAARKGVVTLTEGAVTIEGIPITASGMLALTEPYKFDAVVKTTGTRVTDLRRLVPEVKLPLPVEGALETDSKVAGTLAPLAFTATGRVTASDLTLGKTAANRLDANWQVTEDRLKLTALEATVFGGTISGSLDYPFAAEKAGSFDVSFKGVDAAAAAAFVPDFPVRLTGAVSGKVAGAIPAAKDEPGRVGNLDVDLTAPRLTVQGIPAERLVGKVVVKGGTFDYALEGRTLGGSFEVKGRYPGRTKEPPAKDDRGRLRVTDVDLSQLAGALRSDALKPLGGRVDVTFDYANDLSSGSGRVLIRGLTWGTDEASPEIVGALLLRDGFLELRDLGGTLARGQLRGRARVSLEDPTRNFIAVSLERADARRLLAPVPDLAGVLDGNVSVEVRARFGRAIHGSGSVTLSRGAIGGSGMGEIRIPFDFATSPGGFGRFAVREVMTLSGSGRTTGAVAATWGPGAGATVKGQVRFVDLPLRAISPAIGETAFLGAGRITGRVDVSGSNVRSAHDLTSTLVASLNNTSVKEVPLLRQATPFLNPIGVTKPFQTGDIRGTLARGVFRVQRLALANPSAQVFAEGSITLEGRLDLDVVAHTGTIGPDIRGLRAFGLRLPTLGPVPLTLIRDVSDFLSNRTIRLTISGTAANPVVRLNTGALLTQEAVRFFLTRYVVPPELAASIGLGTADRVVGGSNGSNR